MWLCQRYWLLESLFLLFLYFELVVCNESDEPWFSIVTTTTYNNLPQCAQECLLDVTSVTNCTTYGCVCSDNTNGNNFIMGYTFISNCTTVGCSDQGLTNDAVLAFRDICAAAYDDTTTTTTTSSTSSTRTTPVPVGPGLPTDGIGQTGGVTTTSSSAAPPSPTETKPPDKPTIHLIKPPSYTRLPPCSRFALNSCFSDSSPSDLVEPGCSPSQKPPGWESYRGLASQLNCNSAQSTAACICANSSFHISYNTLYNQSAYFCNYLPSVHDYISEEYDNLQGAPADYCADNGYTPDGYALVLTGTAQDEHHSGCLREAEDHDELKAQDKIAIAIGVPGFFVSVLTLFLQLWYMRYGPRPREDDDSSRSRSSRGGRGRGARVLDEAESREDVQLRDMPQ